MDQSGPPARRADARRNRTRILAAARSAFADPDVPVSMAEVARRADVGMATLYRNFPSRRELLEHTDTSNPVFGDSRARVLAAGRPLLMAAQASREIRADLTLEQILDLLVAIAGIRSDARFLKPILRAALDGLRPPA